MSVSAFDLLNSDDLIARMKDEFLAEGSRQAAERLFQKRFAKHKNTTARILYEFAVEAFKSAYDDTPSSRISMEKLPPISFSVLKGSILSKPSAVPVCAM